MALLGRDTSVTGPFPAGILLLETLSGTEALGEPYLFELGLLSKHPSIDPDYVLGNPMAVGFKLSSGEWRYFHGVVTSFAKSGTKSGTTSGSTHRYTRYAAKLCPRLSLCDHTSDCRIFNKAKQDAVSIVKRVLAERDITPVKSDAIQGHVFRKRDLCVQYQESVLHFAQRLLEEEGLYYFFEHGQEDHTLVLANAVGAHTTSPGYEFVSYAPEQRKLAQADEHFWGMTVRKGMHAGQHTILAGYDPSEKRPRQTRCLSEFSGEPAPGNQFEHYDHPGGLYYSEEAAREAKVRTQVEYVEKNVIAVEGNTMGLGVGHLVTVLPDLDNGGEVFPFWTPLGFAKQYLIIRAQYALSVDQYETGKVAGSDTPFKATYILLDSQTPFRPRRILTKPRMGGPQTALVVGPAAEEIWTDKQGLGRVRIQFDWDRRGQHNENSTCWVRSTDMWSGPGWGGQHLPRIGQEVVVRFLDGDPDRPIVTGALYNADNMPPYELPAHATQSGIKSHSSKGGGPSNFNEIRFEDKKGAEELHVQAEKDMSTLVKHCQTLHVGRDRSVVVGNDEDNLVNGNRELTVNINDEVTIGGDHDKTVVGPVLQLYGAEHTRTVNGEQELVAEQNKEEHVKQAYKLTTDKKFQLVQDATSMTFKNKNVTLSSAGEIVITAGGATFSMEKDGMTTFESPAGIKLVCGASSLAVTPAGVSLAAPNLTAAAGAGSTMAIGKDTIAMKSRKVSITADGVCSVWGRNKLKLQESDKDKAKRSRKGGGAGDEAAGAGAKEKQKQQAEKQAMADGRMLEIHVIDLKKKPQEGLAFQIKKPDGTTESGELDKDGRGKVTSTAPGTFTVTFPDLDGADWDGDGAQPLPPEDERIEASCYRVQQGDRMPSIALDHGFARWETIWDFSANQALKDLRKDPHVLFPRDKVAIPSKLERKALVPGGGADFKVHRSAETLRVQFDGLESSEDRPISFKARLDSGQEIARKLSPDGTMEIDLPEDTRRVVVELFTPDSKEPIVATFLVGHLDPPAEVSGVQARLASLGYYSGQCDGKLDEETCAAIAAFRAAVLGEDPGSSEIDGRLVEALEGKYRT